MPAITVFTPVYNRSRTLNRLYESLKRQSFKDFEWLIVDDGSTDNSVELIKEFINEKSLNIELTVNSHGGKHRAVNTGLSLAKGRLFFFMDSDDYLTDDALEKIIQWEKMTSDNMCAGICGRMSTPDGRLIGKKVKKPFWYMGIDRMIKKGIACDHADALYTDIFRNYMYPEIEGEYHIAPGVPYMRMAMDGYKLLMVNEAIYVADYQEDGLTAMGDKKIFDNYKGYTLRSKELMRCDVGYKRKLEVLAKYSYITVVMNKGIREIKDGLEVSNISAFLGYVMGQILKSIKSEDRQ